MNNRQIEMEKMLKALEEISLRIDSNVSKDTVYYYLTRGLISKEERPLKINNFFSMFMNYFKNKNNINVFNPNSSYFCHFFKF